MADDAPVHEPDPEIEQAYLDFVQKRGPKPVQPYEAFVAGWMESKKRVIRILEDFYD